ncbi:F420-0:gamma-glutamyl ligase [Desulfitispora alkaliphila]
MRTIGTQVRGIRAPIVKNGDDIVDVVVTSLQKSWEAEGFQLKEKDVVGITESLVARAQGNYVTVDEIVTDLKNRFQGCGEIGVVFPILSRNRFSIILKAISKAFDKVYLQLSYPADEVGNHLMDVDKMDELNINPYTDSLSEKEYRKLFGQEVKHPFTGVDYVKEYKEVGNDDNIEIVLSNDPTTILNYTQNILVADVHTRYRTEKVLKKNRANKVLRLDGICTEATADNTGYNPEYGLLGSNKATGDSIKLFPRHGKEYVDKIQMKIKGLTGKNIEVLIYGDGAFKDPVGKIWELADPVVSPAYTDGLEGTPNELKLKYLVDNNLTEVDVEQIDHHAKEFIKKKDNNLIGKMEAQGTTPRQLTDLLGSLCDLTSGSGDKGTPIILIQGYFDNFATD